MKLSNLVKDIKLRLKKECFDSYKEKNGKCYGICGGGQSTGYLSPSCASCPYLYIYNERENNNVSNDNISDSILNPLCVSRHSY